MVEVREISNSVFDPFRNIEVYVVNGATERFLLNSFLPNYWQICEKVGARLHTDPERKKIIIPSGYFSLDGNIFSLLHEIGHAIVDESKSEEEVDEEIFLRDKYNYDGPASFTAQEKIRFRKLVIESEKAAWEWALKTIVNYRNRGVDLEPSLAKNDLKRLANQKLVSYLR